MPTFHESSGQRSMRDADALGQQWKKNTVPTRQIAQLTRNVSSLSRQVNQMRRRILPGYVKPPDVALPMHPFKIYQPTNYTEFATGITFLGTDGTSTVCNIDATKPTDFGTNPPTVNPTTDAWRFWAVRSGFVEFRPIYSITNEYDAIDGSDWGTMIFDISYSDGVLPGDYSFDDPTTKTMNPPLILSSHDVSTSVFQFWVIITPDDDSTNWPTAAIAMRNLSYDIPSISSDLNLLIGCVGPSLIGNNVYGLPMWVDQETFDHFIGRYPPGNGNFANGGLMNFRGIYDTDSNTYTPDDLESQAFYTGDIISEMTSGDASKLYQFTSKTPLFGTEITNPENWIQIL